MKVKIIAVSTLLIAIIAVGSFLLYSNYLIADLKPETSPTPTPYVYPYIKPTPSYSIGLSQYQINVTQGETFHIGITISSFLNTVIKFTPQIQLYTIGNEPVDTSKDYQNIYNATFTQTQILMGPYGNATDILTIKMAPDTQVGRYLFYVSHSSSDSGWGVMTQDALEVFVTPKTA